MQIGTWIIRCEQKKITKRTVYEVRNVVSYFLNGAFSKKYWLADEKMAVRFVPKR